MTDAMNPYPNKLADVLMIILGLIMLVTPLALWVAWSNTMFFVILMTGLGSTWAYWAIYRASHATDNPPVPDQAFPRQVSEEAMEVLHAGWPWYCHHTTDGTSRFRNTMNKFADLTGTARRY
jgi:hypothetical protein